MRSSPRVQLPHAFHLLLVGLMAFFLADVSTSREGELPSLRSSAPSEAAGVGQYTGPGSCSSSSCHGSVKPRAETRIAQNEYSIWVVKDKHSRAFAALSEPVAQRMAHILSLPRPETAPKCLACHALDVPAERRARTFELSDGVSCENCHGPAAGWLGPHTTLGSTHAQSLALGMYDTRSLPRRTELCLSCHLGGRDKFVDHEMIAAGHPDLYFELDSFSAVMPRHWKEPADASPWRNVQEWATGQTVQLRLDLERLEGRARGKVWPEYSELDCFACHHSLVAAAQSWRQERGYTGRRPGDPPWNASRYAVLRELLHQVAGRSVDPLDAEMEKLTAEMNRLNPDREAVAAGASRAAALIGGLQRQVEAQNYDAALTLGLLRAIAGDGDAISGQGERAAEQAAMALDSLVIAYSRNAHFAAEAELRATINELFQQVENPSAYNQFDFAARLRKINALLH